MKQSHKPDKLPDKRGKLDKGSAEQFSEMIMNKFAKYAKRVARNRLYFQDDLRFKNVVDSSPMPILITSGRSPVIDYVNPAWEKITGYKLDEVKGKNPNVVKSQKTPSRIYKKIWEELSRGNTFKTELLFDRNKNGIEFQMSSTFFPVKENNLTKFYAQIEHDITARKTKEKYRTMHINIAQLLAVSNNVRSAVTKSLKYLCEGIGWELGELWLVNNETKALYYFGEWHSQYIDVKRFIALSKKTILLSGQGLPGRVWATSKPSWIINSDKSTYFPNLKIAAKSGLTTALAFPIMVEGKIIGILTFFTLKARKPDEDLLKTMRSLGNHLGQFIEHRRAEEISKKLTIQQQLILNAAGQGIYGVNKKGELTFINPAAEQMLGWGPADLLGKRVHEVIHHTKNDGQTKNPYSECPMNKILSGKPSLRIFDSELLWRKDGTSFQAEMVVSPIMDRKKIIGAVISFIDITKRHELDELKKEFLATAAHELKTPITTLKLATQMQIKKLKRRQSVTIADFEILDRELSRLTRIINDILDEQRAETGKLNLKLKKIALGKLIQEVVRKMKNVSSTHKIEFEKTQGVFVRADADRIGQVLTNLITNAIKYSPGHTQIAVGLKIENNSAVVFVKDEGRGIAKDKQDKIFDRFYQIKEKSSGFGLGLYISKQIIESHGGRIWVKSKEGEGSTFYFSLPVLEINSRD